MDKTHSINKDKEASIGGNDKGRHLQFSVQKIAGKKNLYVVLQVGIVVWRRQLEVPLK